MASQYHEPPEELPHSLRDLTRILVSLKEEIEAIDWYNQRIELASSSEVRDILRHNQQEEMEHAAMALEFLRRNMSGWDHALRTYLFTEGAITELEHEAHGDGPNPAESPEQGKRSSGSLGIGNLGRNN